MHAERDDIACGNATEAQKGNRDKLVLATAINAAHNGKVHPGSAACVHHLTVSGVRRSSARSGQRLVNIYQALFFCVQRCRVAC